MDWWVISVCESDLFTCVKILNISNVWYEISKLLNIYGFVQFRWLNTQLDKLDKLTKPTKGNFGNLQFEMNDSVHILL